MTPARPAPTVADLSPTVLRTKHAAATAQTYGQAMIALPADLSHSAEVEGSRELTALLAIVRKALPAFSALSTM